MTNTRLGRAVRVPSLILAGVFIGLAGLDASIPGVEVANSQQKFMVFDGTLYKNKPDLSQYGVTPITILYEDRLLESSPKTGGLPPKDAIRKLAVEAAQLGHPVILDIERWPIIGDPVVVDASLVKYRTVLQWFHEAVPTTPVGYYATVPIPDYWRAFKDQTSAEYLSWQRDNDRLHPLVGEMNALFPSIYTFYADRSGWVTYAVAQIREARRHANGKPVYAFIWPQYHESNTLLGGRFLDADYWELELLTLKQHADGVVIWGGWGNSGPEPWNEDAPWWRVTKTLLPKLGISNLKPPRDVSVY